MLAQDHLPKYEAKLGETPPNGELSAYEMLDWKLDQIRRRCRRASVRWDAGPGVKGYWASPRCCWRPEARSVCLSLWKVDDTATYLLMSRFYENLLGKRDGLKRG